MNVQVRFHPSGAHVSAPAGTMLMDAVLRAGLPIASACGADGLCGRCGVRVLAGAESLIVEGADETRAKQRNRIDPELRLACRTVLSGDLEVTASYW
jgi:adenylate cyclase